MKILKDLRIGLFTSIFLVSMWGVYYWTYSFYKKNCQQSQISLELEYNRQIDSINIVNDDLLGNIEKLNKTVDSLMRIKTEIQWKYAEDVKIVTNADAANHARWLSTTISELRNNTK